MLICPLGRGGGPAGPKEGLPSLSDEGGLHPYCLAVDTAFPLPPPEPGKTVFGGWWFCFVSTATTENLPIGIRPACTSTFCCCCCCCIIIIIITIMVSYGVPQWETYKLAGKQGAGESDVQVPSIIPIPLPLGTVMFG